jgi:hypothetical protein
MGAELARGTSVGAWTGDHPWAALSGAMIAGFAIASLVVPTKEQQALQRLAKIERALHPVEVDESADKAATAFEGNGRSATKHQPPGLLGGLLRDVVRAGVPALSQILAAALRPGVNPTPEDVTNDTGDITPT